MLTLCLAARPQMLDPPVRTVGVMIMIMIGQRRRLVALDERTRDIAPTVALWPAWPNSPPLQSGHKSRTGSHSSDGWRGRRADAGSNSSSPWRQTTTAVGSSWPAKLLTEMLIFDAIEECKALVAIRNRFVAVCRPHTLHPTRPSAIGPLQCLAVLSSPTRAAEATIDSIDFFTNQRKTETARCNHNF